jgi:hypothetical protein
MYHILKISREKKMGNFWKLFSTAMPCCKEIAHFLFFSEKRAISKHAFLHYV